MALPLLTEGARPLGNRNDQARRQNLSTILTLLHHHGPATRADLTRVLGLNRSTIATLVAELTELGLVLESPADSTNSVGRPSLTVHADERVAVVSVVPDSDAITVGIVGLGGAVHERVRMPVDHPPTPQTTIQTTRLIMDGLHDSLAGFRIVHAGVAVPGLVRSSAGVVELAPHLGWRNEPIAEKMADALGLPTVVVNDAHAGLMAETRFGAGRGVQDLVYLNGSYSGIGGGVLIAGSPLLGARGLAGELGHVSVGGNRTCHCGRTGCLETEVRFGALLAASPPTARAATALDAIALDGTDTALHTEIERQLDILAASLADLVSVLNPSHFLLGGFLGALFATNPRGFRARVAEAAFAPLATEVTIERAALGYDLLVIGAAEAAFQNLLANPVAFQDL